MRNCYMGLVKFWIACSPAVVDAKDVLRAVGRRRRVFVRMAVVKILGMMEAMKRQSLNHSMAKLSTLQNNRAASGFPLPFRSCEPLTPRIVLLTDAR